MSKDNAAFIVGGAGFFGGRLVSYLDTKYQNYLKGDINGRFDKTINLDINSETLF